MTLHNKRIWDLIITFPTQIEADDIELISSSEESGDENDTESASEAIEVRQVANQLYFSISDKNSVKIPPV